MGECTCHLNPPCGFCLEKRECRHCGDFYHPDDTALCVKREDDVCEAVDE